MNPYDDSWPTPDTTALDPRGDIFLGRRLPEYRFTFEFQNQEHPIRIIGRHAHCEVHGNATTKAMKIGGCPLPCRIVSDQYDQQFTLTSSTGIRSLRDALTAIFEASTVMSVHGTSGDLYSIFDSISAAVTASMADQVSKSSGHHMSLRTVVDGSSLGIDTRRFWLTHPEKYWDAHDHGCSYATWTVLTEAGVPQLARPGFIDSSGDPTDLLIAICGALPHVALSTIIPLWDQALDAVDVYGAPLRMLESMPTDEWNAPQADVFLYNYFSHMPVTSDSELLRSYVKMATMQTPSQEIGQVGMSDATWVDDFRAHREYFAVGIPRDAIPAYVKAGISPAEAAEGMCQGIVTAEGLLRVQEVAKQHPKMPFSRVSWLDQLQHMGVALKPSLSELPPLSDLPDNSAPLDRTHNREALLYASVVPSDWWQNLSVAGASLEDEEMENSLSL